jgi:hypothetical protein
MTICCKYSSIEAVILHVMELLNYPVEKLYDDSRPICLLNKFPCLWGCTSIGIEEDLWDLVTPMPPLGTLWVFLSYMSIEEALWVCWSYMEDCRNSLVCGGHMGTLLRLSGGG